MTEIPLGSSWENLGCSASDDVDGYVACRVVLDEVNPDKVGIYKIIFEAIDSSNNIATLEIYITVYNPSMGDNPYPSLTYDPNNVYVKYIDLGKYGDNDLGESAYIKIGDIDILVDSGMGYSYTMQSIYEVLDAGITGELDYIIATHPHADHIGGFPKIFEKYDVKMAIEFSSPYSTNVVANYITARENEPNLNYCKITENVRGSSKDYCVDTYYLAPSISMEFIDTNFYESSDPNSSSIVFVLNVFGTRILFNGDAEKSQEAVYAPKVGKVDIFKLGHHGSKNATEFVLLTNINPEVAIITNGNYLGNSNGHPTPEAINRIYNFNSSINIYATTGGNGTALDKFIDRNGTLTLSVNSNGYSISAEYSPLKELSQTTFWINHPLRQYAHS